MSDKKPHRSIDDLRSQRWFAADNMRGFAHRQRTQQMGMRREEFMGKPVIAIINTWSEMSPCHAHLRDRAQAIKRGVWQAGGYPVELPALSVGEVMVKPTTMLYRNFLAMETEELLRSHPIDGAVLLGGCDKSTPGLIMGAISMNLPVIFCPAGAMANAKWHGHKTGAGTHTKKYWDELRAGNITASDWVDLESHMTRSPGTCNTMGTASTMTAIVDAMGLTLPGASSITAIDSEHSRMASACGVRIVNMVWENLQPSHILSRDTFLNGATVYMAMGGSTNAAIHLLAMALRAGVKLSLEDLAAVAARIPVLANLFPSGKYLMEDFYFAGGILALMRHISPHLALDLPTVSGLTVRQAIADAACWNDDVIRCEENPVVSLKKGKTLQLLKGNLAPHGAVIKSSAASTQFIEHRGPAIVFDDPETMNKTLDDPDLDIDENWVIVLRNAGPVGAPGMPEWGNLPIPKKMLKKGVRDMVRICDGRMSGTHYGTCILHVAPEAAVGGPLALLQTGDIVVLNIQKGLLNMEVDDDELKRRQQAWKPSPSPYKRSFTALYQRHVNQADEGCDFDFLTGTDALPEPPIY